MKLKKIDYITIAFLLFTVCSAFGAEPITPTSVTSSCFAEAIDLGLTRSQAKEMCGKDRIVWPIRCYEQMMALERRYTPSKSEVVTFCAKATNVWCVRCYEGHVKTVGKNEALMQCKNECKSFTDSDVLLINTLTEDIAKTNSEKALKCNQRCMVCRQTERYRYSACLRTASNETQRSQCHANYLQRVRTCDS